MPGPALEGREDALQRHPELTEIDLKDDDVVCGRLDPVLEEDPPAGPQLEEAGDSFPVGSAPALGVPATRAPGSAAPEPPRYPDDAPPPPPPVPRVDIRTWSGSRWTTVPPPPR